MTKITFDPHGAVSPESRADILAEVVRYMALRMEPVPYDALLSHILTSFSAREEDAAGEVQAAFSMLVHKGLLTSNDHDRKRQTITLRSGTTVSPSRWLTSYAWAAPAEAEDDE